MKVKNKKSIILTFNELEALINKHLKDSGSEVQITIKNYEVDHFTHEFSYDVVELVPMMSEHATAFPIAVDEKLGKPAFTQ